jgi:hypothetical protein
MSDLIQTRHGRVLQLTLNRPAARNALNNALLSQLAETLEAAAVDSDISACVIAGDARFFAAGADLNEMAEKDLPATLNDVRPQLWGRINNFTKPLIAAVNGYALGAGCELVLLCDVSWSCGLCCLISVARMAASTCISAVTTSSTCINEGTPCVNAISIRAVLCGTGKPASQTTSVSVCPRREITDEISALSTVPFFIFLLH